MTMSKADSDKELQAVIARDKLAFHRSNGFGFGPDIARKAETELERYARPKKKGEKTEFMKPSEVEQEKCATCGGLASKCQHSPASDGGETDWSKIKRENRGPMLMARATIDPALIAEMRAYERARAALR